MAMTCKIIAMFTISMGALALKVTLLIYGWMSTPLVLVTGGLILLVKPGSPQQHPKSFDNLDRSAMRPAV